MIKFEFGIVLITVDCIHFSRIFCLWFDSAPNFIISKIKGTRRRFIPQTLHVCGRPLPAVCSGWTQLHWQLELCGPSWHGRATFNIAEKVKWTGLCIDFCVFYVYIIINEDNLAKICCTDLPKEKGRTLLRKEAKLAWQDCSTFCLLKEQTSKQHHLSALCCKAAGQWQIPL